MQDGALAGARFDAAIDTNTDYKTDGLTAPLPYLSANDPDTAANELRTHLVVTGNAEDGMGMFSFSDLLGSGMASSEGERYVSDAVKSIEKVRSDVAALLALDSKPAGLDGILDGQWENLNAALDSVFGTNSKATGATNSDTPSGRLGAPREEDILDEIDDILAALASEANFVAATHGDRDNRGAFASQGLGAAKATDTFNRVKWTATATMGMTGSTRYGTVIRKASTDNNAKQDPTTQDFGAFSYSTMAPTARTGDVVAPTGIASYAGGTEAISGSGKTYSGTMELQVRFSANLVSGVVSGLEDADGIPWQHNFADVDRIILDDATLRRNGTWVNAASRTTHNATVFYTANSGLLRPIPGQRNTFQGRLLGTGAAAGSEANGVWSVGTSGSTGYLAGGFGVMHVGDTARPLPSEDNGSVSNSALYTTVSDATNVSSASIADGTLTVKVRKYGWAGRDGTTAPSYDALTDDKGTPDTADDTNVEITAKFDLAAMAESGGVTVNGPKWIDGVISVLTAQREQLALLQGLSERTTDTRNAEAAAWQKVVDAVQYNMLGGWIPAKLAGNYGSNPTLQADALGLIDRVLDALSSNSKLEAALDPNGTGIFNKRWTDTDGDGTVNHSDTNAELFDIRVYDETQRRNEVAGRTIGNLRGEREHKVIAALGTTAFTRFGIWRRESTRSAAQEPGGVDRNRGGPGTFAYSPLDKARVGTVQNLGFPGGGSATYIGETIANQATNTNGTGGQTLLSGTVRVDVGWGTPADVNAATALGTMSLTISDLANAAGDPLSDGGTTTDTGAGTPGAPGTEIADIVFPGLSILAGGGDDYAGNLIVTGDTTATTLTEVAVTGHRYRRAGLGVTETADLTGDGTASVKALFVGQSVDGPLGLIGTWTLIDASVGRIDGDGIDAVAIGGPIRGAFGAEVP